MRTLLSALVVVAAAASGCANHDGHTTADPGSDRPAAKVVKIEMVDNKFEPVDVTARKGETITFRFTNTGTARHEALVGDAEAQEEHAKEMMSSSTMAGDHDMGDMGGMHHEGADTAVTASAPRKTRGRTDSGVFAAVRPIARTPELQSSASVTIRRSRPRGRSQGGGTGSNPVGGTLLRTLEWRAKRPRFRGFSTFRGENTSGVA
jgi:plastocyanin